MSTSKNRLLAKPSPIRGRSGPESLSSWLFRLAGANGFASYGELLDNAEIKLTPGVSLDVEPDRWGLMDTLQRMSGIPRKQLITHALDPALTAMTGSTGGISGRWMLPSRSSGSRFAFCPECLRDDEKIHWRSAWRLATTTFCVVHRRLLVDACWHCGAPLLIGGSRTMSLARCENCAHRLQESPSPPRVRGVSKWRFIAPQRATHRHFPVPLVHPKLWWDGVLVLLNVLSRHRLASKLLEAQHATALVPILTRMAGGTRLSFGRESISLRHQMLGLADWLTREWPARFVRSMDRARITYGEFCTTELAVPYWLETVCKQWLDRSRYQVSVVEVRSAAEVLQRKGQLVSKIAIKRLLGVTEGKALDVFRPAMRRRLSDVELLLIARALDSDLSTCPSGRDARSALLRDACSIAAAAWLGTSLASTSELKVVQGRRLLKEWHEAAAVEGARGQLASVFYAWMVQYLSSGRLRFERYDQPQQALFLSRFGEPTQGFGLAARFAELLRRCDVAEWPLGARLLCLDRRRTI